MGLACLWTSIPNNLPSLRERERERENKLIVITNITKIPSTYLPPKTKKISYVKGKQLQGVLKKLFCKVKFENNKTSAKQINTGEVKKKFI